VSDAEPVLRQKLCGNTDCRAVFTICVACDRGQRYCCHECRTAVRRQQRKDANRRYQQGEAVEKLTVAASSAIGAGRQRLR